MSARVERLRKEVEVSAAEQDTTFEAAAELDALKDRNKALTELMRLVAGDRPPTAMAEATASSEATGSTSAGDEAARKHAALVKEAEATYNAATEKWRALRDARLDAPGTVKPAEMGAVRTSRRRVKQQMAERARQARGEPAPRPRIHAKDASADAEPVPTQPPTKPPATGRTSEGGRPTPPPANGSDLRLRPAIAPPAPPSAAPSAPPPGVAAAATAQPGWSW